jgi:protein gp37
MAQETTIEWCDATSNPLKYRDRATGETVWGCLKTSPGCAHCYSEAIAQRFDRGGPYTRATMDGLEPFLDDKELRQLLRSKKLTGKRVFLGDMTDVFGEWVPDELLDRLFAVMALRPDVTFQILTKRAERTARYYARLTEMQDRGLVRFIESPFAAALRDVSRLAGHPLPGNAPLMVIDNWPLKNLWLGVSVENQAAADERIPHLLATPAGVRFLSCEPLLGPVDLTPWIDFDKGFGAGWEAVADDGATRYYRPPIHWVICGCESGHGRRPMEEAWATSLAQQCETAGVAFFMKQMMVDGKVSGVVADFPRQLQVRCFPDAE